MKKHTKYWIWDESLNDTGFTVGAFKSQIIFDNLIKTKPDNDGYYGVNSGYPDSISFNNDDRLRTIYFSKKFLKTFKSELWEMNMDEFTRDVNQYLVSCSKDYKGLVLCVVFKDYFPRIALIKRNY